MVGQWSGGMVLLTQRDIRPRFFGHLPFLAALGYGIAPWLTFCVARSIARARRPQELAMIYLARLRKIPCVIAALAVLLLTAPTLAEDQGRVKAMGGLAVYLGILPAVMITGHPAGHTETTMHGGLPSGPRVYHVMVAVFDEASGARIGDAEVTARVAPLGLAGTEKVLEPMTIEDTITYGNFFDMRYSDIYRIQVEIRRPTAQQPVRVEFQYEHSLR